MPSLANAAEAAVTVLNQLGNYRGMEMRMSSVFLGAAKTTRSALLICGLAIVYCAHDW